MDLWKNLPWIVSIGALVNCQQKASSPGVPAHQAPNPGTIGGAAAPVSARVDSSPEAMPATFLEFDVGTRTVYVIKAAGRDALPELAYLGQEEFHRALAGSNGRKLALLHVVVPASGRGIRFRYSEDSNGRDLPEPTLIYRMPDSPLHTFVVVDLRHPGIVSGTDGAGVVGALDLGREASTLESLPPHWYKGRKAITYYGMFESTSRHSGD